MKRSVSSELKADVGELLKSTVATESADKVWRAFESSLRGLDRTALVAIRTYFSGGTIQDVARKLSISEAQAKDLVAQTKREIVEKLRRRCKVRQ
ncbi:MAG: hypothetical protein HYZ71_03565 [Deltaproteobacteria bacterium]|nr:hypothetical protein [Deltaproteobacteria bacterium]